MPVTREAFVADDVPVVSAGAIEADGEVLPAVVLDAAGRPDVADLARVHAVEGMGDLRSGVGLYDVGPRSDWLVRVEVLVDDPVRCRFHLVLDAGEGQALLAAAADRGALAIGCDPPERSGWLAVHVDAEALLPVLARLAEGAPGGGAADGGGGG